MTLRPTIYTVGHSTHPIEEFLEMLVAHLIRQLVDIRRYPGSRRYPQFGQESLAASLRKSGVEYSHEERLGGRRTPREDSPHTYWRNDQFRGYADHMETPEFQAALARLMEGAQSATAIMCSESVPWRCHRNLVADALVARGCTVRHIMSASKADPHSLNPHARLEAGRLIYAEKNPQGELF